MKELIKRYPCLEACEAQITAALDQMVGTYKNGGKILLCGNGGSCADCEHIVGELMKGFLSSRPLRGAEAENIKNMYPAEGEYFVSHLQGALPAISLPSQAAIISAFSNDVAADMVYAQLVLGYGRRGDLLIGISTSGNSVNVINALKIAKAQGLSTLGLSGAAPCLMDGVCDTVIKVPACETYKVQEYHLPVYHYLCAETEKAMFGC